MKSPEINHLALALSKAQMEIQGAVKDSQNPYFKSAYADLHSVWEACREALTKNSLCVIQTTEVTTHGIILVTTLAHESGQYIQGHLPIKPQKEDPQSLGSNITYLRRYALSGIVGIAPKGDDDDAEGAMPDRPQPQVLQNATYESAKNVYEYVISFGKHKGKKLSEVAPDSLQNYADWLESDADKKGKPLSDPAKEYISTVEAYLLAEGYLGLK